MYSIFYTLFISQNMMKYLDKHELFFDEINGTVYHCFFS
jgi:hypothetical protein